MTTLERIEIQNSSAIVEMLPCDESYTPSEIINTRLSVGSFYDRFGIHKYAILASSDSEVRAMIEDTKIRLYIDLANPSVALGLDLLISKGFAIDKNAILNDPVQPGEL